MISDRLYQLNAGRSGGAREGLETTPASITSLHKGNKHCLSDTKPGSMMSSMTSRYLLTRTSICHTRGRIPVHGLVLSSPARGLVRSDAPRIPKPKASWESSSFLSHTAETGESAKKYQKHTQNQGEKNLVAVKYFTPVLFLALAQPRGVKQLRGLCSEEGEWKHSGVSEWLFKAQNYDWTGKKKGRSADILSTELMNILSNRTQDLREVFRVLHIGKVVRSHWLRGSRVIRTAVASLPFPPLEILIRSTALVLSSSEE